MCHKNFKANASKFHSFFLHFNAKSINIKSSVIESNSSEIFLGITIDSNCNFEKRINEFCKKGNLKWHALARCAKLLSTEKRHLIFKVFIISQFNYCQLVCLLNNRMNSMHEKALKVPY